MHVIALRGHYNTGKTETLNILYTKLLEDGWTQVPGLFVNLGGHHDFRAVVEKRGKKIGIATRGDLGWQLDGDLTTLNNARCEKAICACRSRGQTVDVVRQYRNHEFVNKTVPGNSALFRQANENDATILFNRI